MKRGYIALMAITLLVPAVTLRAQSAQAGTHTVDPKVRDEVYRVLDEFIRSFNARDRKAHYATYHFPHYRLASGNMTVLDQPDLSDSTVFVQRLVQAGWHHTKWDHRNIVQASEEKVHVDTQFTRYRADGSKIKTYESLYVLTFEHGRWGIKLRSSFAE